MKSGWSSVGQATQLAFSLRDLPFLSTPLNPDTSGSWCRQYHSLLVSAPFSLYGGARPFPAQKHSSATRPASLSACMQFSAAPGFLGLLMAAVANRCSLARRRSQATSCHSSAVAARRKQGLPSNARRTCRACAFEPCQGRTALSHSLQRCAIACCLHTRRHGCCLIESSSDG